MFDRKIKYLAYISRLQSNHLNQRIQMCFCEKNSSRASKFSLKIFIANSENLNFFSMSIHKVRDVMIERHVQHKRKWNLNIHSFFQKNQQHFWLPRRHNVVLSSIQRYSNDIETTLLICLTYMSEHVVNGPLLNT